MGVLRRALVAVRSKLDHCAQVCLFAFRGAGWAARKKEVEGRVLGVRRLDVPVLLHFLFFFYLSAKTDLIFPNFYLLLTTRHDGDDDMRHGDSDTTARCSGVFVAGKTKQNLGRHRPKRGSYSASDLTAVVWRLPFTRSRLPSPTRTHICTTTALRA